MTDQPVQEPVAWLYPEGLKALQNGKCWTAYPTQHEDCNTPLYIAMPPMPVQEQQAEQIGWAVQGCSKMWRGEFAEIDAKAEAKRIGGTCVAFALYTEPPQRSWVGLTKEDKFEIAEKLGLVSVEWLNLMQVIEDKLKERNCE